MTRAQYEAARLALAAVPGSNEHAEVRQERSGAFQYWISQSVPLRDLATAIPPLLAFVAAHGASLSMIVIGTVDDPTSYAYVSVTIVREADAQDAPWPPMVSATSS